MQKVRIVDIAKELGVSTATVSNVIHGKTKKISDATVKRVQKLLEERQYIPSMAGLLLAQNDSPIIGVVINAHSKYEGRVLEDPFIASSLNALSREIEKAHRFMMLKTTTNLTDIVKFASMWNMQGMIIIGFCQDEYSHLRQFMRIPFVVYDGFYTQELEQQGLCHLTINDYDGGKQVGQYLKQLGHKRALCISDNNICMDAQRIQGFQDGFSGENTDLLIIPPSKIQRREFYEQQLSYIKEHTAVFAVSDYYAIDFMQFVQEKGLKIPQDISLAGFDDTPICQQIVPTLTSVRQDAASRASHALTALKSLIQREPVASPIILPVQLIPRNSTAPLKQL